MFLVKVIVLCGQVVEFKTELVLFFRQLAFNTTQVVKRFFQFGISFSIFLFERCIVLVSLVHCIVKVLLKFSEVRIPAFDQINLGSGCSSSLFELFSQGLHFVDKVVASLFNLLLGSSFVIELTFQIFVFDIEFFVFTSSAGKGGIMIIVLCTEVVIFNVFFSCNCLPMLHGLLQE